MTFIFDQVRSSNYSKTIKRLLKRCHWRQNTILEVVEWRESKPISLFMYDLFLIF